MSTGELDALIVRNISDIGAAASRAKIEIDHRLWRECGAIIEDAAKQAGWLYDNDVKAKQLWVSHPDWLATGDDKDNPPFYVLMNERVVPGPNVEWTWIASFTGAWPSRGQAALFVQIDGPSKTTWKRHLKGAHDLIASLTERGLLYDASSGELYVPIHIDGELLATAFEADDFEAALQPVGEAFQTIAAAKQQLTKLRKSIA